MGEAKRIRRDLNKAREGLFPTGTCPASRHVHMIVENMLDPKCQMRGDLKEWEPTHMAGSIASVLENLWKARRWMKWQPNEEGNYRAGGEWVPDLDALARLTNKDK